MKNLIKHAYLYATYSEEDSQLGAIIVNDDMIIGAGWNQRISGIYVSEIEIALITCQHSLQGAVLVTPMPPYGSNVSLIIVAEITTVVYDERIKELASRVVRRAIEDGFKILEDNNINITRWEDPLGCFKLKYGGKTFEP